MMQTIVRVNFRHSKYVGSVASNLTISDNRNHILCMLISVIALFFISWAPYHVQRLGYVYFRHNHIYRTVNEYLMYFSGFFYYLNATLNPILYNLMSVKYRHAFSTLVFCKPPENPKVLVRATCQIHLHVGDFLAQPIHTQPAIQTQANKLQKSKSGLEVEKSEQIGIRKTRSEDFGQTFV